MIRFFVAGVPKALSVGKGIRVPNKGGGFKQFQERVNSEWSTMVGQIGRGYAPVRPLEGAVSVTALFLVPRPETAPRRVVFPTKRPDVDNLVHKLTDQFNGVFWRDDSQVVDMVARKRFAPDGRTGVLIIVEEVTTAQLALELPATLFPEVAGR